MEFHLFRTRWREFQVPAMMEILELVCVRGWCLRWCQRCDKQLCSLSSFPPLLLHQRFSSNSICPSHLPEGWSAERGGPRWSWRCFPEDFVVKGSKGPRAEMEVQETLTLVILTGLKSPGRRRSMRRLIPVFCFIHPPPSLSSSSSSPVLLPALLIPQPSAKECVCASVKAFCTRCHQHI